VTEAVAIVMVLIVLVGVAIGVLLPLALTRLGFDPAIASDHSSHRLRM
jgi:Mg/Co/Ni transporter MgtE